MEAANKFGSKWANMPFLHRLRGPLEVQLVLAGPAVTQQTISLCPSQQWRAPWLVANRSPLPPEEAELMMQTEPRHPSPAVMDGEAQTSWLTQGSKHTLYKMCLNTCCYIIIDFRQEKWSGVIHFNYDILIILTHLVSILPIFPRRSLLSFISWDSWESRWSRWSCRAVWAKLLKMAQTRCHQMIHISNHIK